MTDNREMKLADWGQRVGTAIQRGVFTNGQRVAIRGRPQAIPGPRAGALEFDVGIGAGVLLTGLQAHDCAMMRQFIPWAFEGEPAAFLSGRWVRIEAGWSTDLAESDIPLESLPRHLGAGRWAIGKSEMGATITAGLDDTVPHWLVSGATGSGKTTALVSAVGQFGRDPSTRLVLIDCKHGASLRPVANVRGRVGPLAGDIFTARAALSWCCQEMARRYTGGLDDRRLIVVVDELQELVNDPLASEAVRKLVAQGRGAKVHLIVATQHPVVSALGGPTVGRNLVGRLALRVADAKASEVAVGASFPRADHLLGRGDGYAIRPGVVHRVQVAYISRHISGGDPEFDEWPEETGELPDLGGWPSASETGAAIVAAGDGIGRVKFARFLEENGLPSTCPERAVKLLTWARAIQEWLSGRGYNVRSFGHESTHKTGENGSERNERVCIAHRTNEHAQLLPGGVQ